MTRNKIIIIAAASILVIGGLVIWGLDRSSSKDLLQENPNLPENEWSRVVQIEEDKNYKTLVNEIDGYEISVPDNWYVSETASVKGGLRASYNPEGNYDTAEFHQGVMLNILTFKNIEETKDYFPLSTRFEDVKTEAGPAYRTSYKAIEDTMVDGKPAEAPIENSLVVKYIFPADKKVYLVSCFGLGDGFGELVSLCEKQILTFKILK